MQTGLFTRNKVYYWATIAILFLTGLGIRLYDLTDPPLDFNATRQLHSAIKTRGYYYAFLPAESGGEQREAAMRMGAEIETLEPPLMEWMTALTYLLTGGEYLWIGRLYAILFWMLGAVATFMLVKELLGGDAAVLAFAFFLFLPYAAIASRAFMPDPLMVTLIVFAWWAILRWARAPTWRASIIAGTLGGLAVLCKFNAVFFIAGAFAGAVLGSHNLRQAIRSLKVWLVGIIAVLPYSIYFIYARFIAAFLDPGTFRFFPQLWREPAFYLRWSEAVNGTVSLEWAVVGLVGTLLLRQRVERMVLGGIWLGYFVYGMTLPYHIITHDYYQLPLVPLAGIGLATTAMTLWQNLKATPRLGHALAVALLLFGTVINAWAVRVKLKEVDYRGEAIFWQRLGERLGRDARVAGLIHDYGFRLAYWGWLPSANWMTSGDFALRQLAGQEHDFDALFERATQGKDFFVVTLISELEGQPYLRNRLYGHYPVEEEPGYLLFDLRHPLNLSD